MLHEISFDTKTASYEILEHVKHLTGRVVVEITIAASENRVKLPTKKSISDGATAAFGWRHGKAVECINAKGNIARYSIPCGMGPERVAIFVLTVLLGLRS